MAQKRVYEVAVESFKRCRGEDERSTAFRFIDLHNLPFGHWLPLEVQDKIMERKYWLEWKERINKVNFFARFGVYERM